MAPWTCTICLEAFSSAADRNDIPLPPGSAPDSSSAASEAACTTCLRRAFRVALASESSWPVRWGSLVLRPRDFAGALGSRFVGEYEAREEEYRVPAGRRVYCSCGKFLGSMLDADEEGGEGRVVVCAACEGRWCRVCAGTCGHGRSAGEEGEEHECVPERRFEERSFALGSLRRGRDWQCCPACERLVELTEACNHISCPCGAEFCYVCGREVGLEELEWHWDIRRCARWGARDEMRLPPNVGVLQNQWGDVDENDFRGMVMRENDPFIPRLLTPEEREDLLQQAGPEDDPWNNFDEFLYDPRDGFPRDDLILYNALTPENRTIVDEMERRRQEDMGIAGNVGDEDDVQELPERPRVRARPLEDWIRYMQRGRNDDPDDEFLGRASQ